MNKDRGVRCPYCNCAMNEVVRTMKVFGKTRRRRLCRHCRRTFHSVETPEKGPRNQDSADMRESDG